MIIKREINGAQVDIELTYNEKRLAGEEIDMANRAEDVLGKLKELAESGDIPLMPEQLKLIPDERLKVFALKGTHAVENYLGKDVNYWEAFWASLEFTLKERINWDEELPELLAEIPAAREVQDS